MLLFSIIKFIIIGFVSDNSDTFLNFQDTKTDKISCDGLLTQLQDGDSHWFHCTKPGDAERQIDIVSKENKIVLKVTRDASEMSSLKLRMSYRAEPIEEIIGMCEFGWVAMRQFCVSVLDRAKMSWSKAESECMKLGGHLVSLRSERDQRIVNDLLTNR